jgi:hypothetical protein
LITRDSGSRSLATNLLQQAAPARLRVKCVSSAGVLRGGTPVTDRHCPQVRMQATAPHGGADATMPPYKRPEANGSQ